MKILIIEDEPLAQDRLVQLIEAYDPSYQIMGIADSITQSVELLNSDLAYDLIFCDIELADGSSFEIFKELSISKPIIFLTAYDQFALDAFEVHCLDYILKPVSKDKLEKAFEKLKSFKKERDGGNLIPEDLISSLVSIKKADQYKKRFLAKLGNKLVFKKIEEVSYFYAEGRTVYLIEKNNGKKFIIDHSLEELEKDLLDPNQFYRINRSFIVNLDDLLEIRSYYNGRLKLHVNTQCEKDIIVAREKVSNFKSWLNQ